MYGELFESDGQKVFILCCPDTPYVEKLRKARAELQQLEREQSAFRSESELSE